MSELPASWATVSLSDVGTAITGNTPPTSNPANYGQDVPYIKPPDLVNRVIESPQSFLSNEGAAIARTLPPLAVLVTCIGNLGRVGISRTRVAFNQQINAVVPGVALYPFFLFYVAQSHAFRTQLESKASATTISIVNKGNFERITIPLPPLAEQKRIVAKIEELFSELEAGEESLRLARRQLGVYRQSLLKQAFEGKLTAQWRTQNPALLESPASLLARIQSARQSRYDKQLKEWETAMAAWKADGEQSSKPRRPSAPEIIASLPCDIADDLAELPAPWFWGKLALMTLGIEYGTGAKSSKTGSCPVIRMGNLQGGEIDWDDLAFTSDETEISQYRLAPGDVLFNRTNSPEWVGKTAIYRGQRAAVFAGYLMRVNHISSVVCSGYLNYFLNSGVAREYGNTVKTDGVNQSNINGVKLAGYPFPYCSLSEQQEIVRVLDEQFEGIERNEREIDGALQSSEALRQAILKKAFTGRLVPHDPADEPASTLLARLRAERETIPDRPAKRGQRRLATDPKI